MLLPDFKTAQLQAPSGRSSSPSWLEGVAAGRPVFLLGGADGLVDSPGLEAARGQLVIGTNWTLRALVPTIWHVVDKNVYHSERNAVGGCPDSLVVVANQGIFGQGVFSMKGGVQARMIGSKLINPYHITIARPKGTVLCPDGVRRNGVSAPFIPKSITEEYHPGGNSLCYTIQTAHLMGSEEIYALGFTLKSGGGYFFGSKNPVTKRTSIYDDRRALDWLSWYQSTWPGRARLTEGWDGPAYDVLQKVTNDELLSKFCEPKDSPEWLL